jgi:error-prone DNA polymerase
MAVDRVSSKPLSTTNYDQSEELRHCRNGEFVRTAGCVIARQRPGTAKGFIFISLEDETGIANVIVTPDLYDQYLEATRLIRLSEGALEVRSHDFH